MEFHPMELDPNFADLPFIAETDVDPSYWPVFAIDTEQASLLLWMTYTGEPVFPKFARARPSPPLRRNRCRPLS